jgi:hypothetical protein
MYDATIESLFNNDNDFILNLPSKSVVIPTDVPLNTTLTKGIGSPEAASVTLPEIMVSCPYVRTKRELQRKKERKPVFITIKS